MVAQKRKAAAKTESRIAFSADATQRSSSSTQMTTSFLSVPQPAIDPNAPPRTLNDTRAQGASSRERGIVAGLAIPGDTCKSSTPFGAPEWSPRRCVRRAISRKLVKHARPAQVPLSSKFLSSQHRRVSGHISRVAHKQTNTPQQYSKHPLFFFLCLLVV